RRAGRQVAFELQCRRCRRLVLLFGGRPAGAGGRDPGQRGLRVRRPQPGAADGARRGAVLRNGPAVARSPGTSRRPGVALPQSRLRGGLAHGPRVQLAEPESGTHMVARAVGPRHLSAITLLLAAAVGACARGDARAADPLVFVNETVKRVDALHDSNYRFDAL